VTPDDADYRVATEELTWRISVSNSGEFGERHHRELFRLWLAGEGIRAIERLVAFDRKTVRRYLEAAGGLGLVCDGGEEQLTDAFIGLVVEAVRPHRSDGHGEAWRLLVANHDQIRVWVDDDLTAVKIAELLGRRGIAVPGRTVQRYVAEGCGRTRGQGPTVQVVDGEPGDEILCGKPHRISYAAPGNMRRRARQGRVVAGHGGAVV